MSSERRSSGRGDGQGRTGPPEINRAFLKAIRDLRVEGVSWHAHLGQCGLTRQTFNEWERAGGVSPKVQTSVLFRVCLHVKRNFNRSPRDLGLRLETCQALAAFRPPPDLKDRLRARYGISDEELRRWYSAGASADEMRWISNYAAFVAERWDREWEGTEGAAR